MTRTTVIAKVRAITTVIATTDTIITVFLFELAPSEEEPNSDVVVS